MTNPLPDFDLAGLRVSELHTLWEYLRPMGDQFDSAYLKGSPFTTHVETGPYAGCVQDTQIGATISVIHDWAMRQLRNVIMAMAEAPADLLSLSLKAEVLLHDAATSEDWEAAASIVQRLRDEEDAIRGDK